jgi:putative endonuclease
MSNKKNNTIKGKEAEDLATQFLVNLGYEILVRNYRYQRGEIDIIAKIADTIVFVEVKSRKNEDFGFPEEAVTPKKQDLIHTTAENYLLENDLQNDIRFDIIAIVNQEVTHLIDAF